MEELLVCPFCGSHPVWEGDGDNWKDDSRYVEMKLECCITMSAWINWRAARDMTRGQREEILKKKLQEKWNTRYTEYSDD